MKFHPILFSTEMVKAILSGRKKQTRRRAHKNDAELETIESIPRYLGNEEDWGKFLFTWEDGDNVIRSCPYGQPGDVLWVREVFCSTSLEYLHNQTKLPFCYKADVADPEDQGIKNSMKNMGWRWKPSIHMPKEACRIFLQIKSIRVERLQDITEADAIAEGVEMKMRGIQNYIDRPVEPLDAALYPYKILFSDLWSKINGAESWTSNPWVWVIEFEQISKPNNFQ